MPVEVKAYGCQFGCQKRLTKSKSIMAKHEKTCAKNPERRACKICKHKRSAFIPSANMPDSHERVPSCALQAMPYGSLMHFNCEKWEAA